MKDRIKQIRNENVHGKSQKAFAEWLGIPLSNYQSYETGRRSPSDGTISLICNKCFINKQWLLTGEGEMKIQKTKEDEISDIAAMLYHEGDQSFRYQMIKLISQMDVQQMKALKELLLMFADAAKDTE